LSWVPVLNLGLRTGARRGVLNLPGIEEDVGLIGIHWRGQFIELVPWNGSVRPSHGKDTA